MEFTEELINQTKEALQPIIARFTNDVKEISVVIKQTRRGVEYLDIETNEIRMTPCVFKRLHISGEAHNYMDDNNIEYLGVRLLWCWESFNGGSNGTELATIHFSLSSYGDLRVREICL